ncbi:MAG TPA: hypothetical protein VFY73_01930 [Ideonella sp.]|uniref:hypothetical protein n=1 Tax=Ideonella sp. TaxID=1929293 RepID=UPI002E33DFC4|nr:hypothetical protein [Ideonella sp.]HEX5682767.1 hypothetical protein [Ideonella sp.]
MLFKETFILGGFPRKPEDHLVMDSQDQVDAWHAQGSGEGPILSIYHLNALACSRLTASGGTVIDVACGTGRFAAYLAKMRAAGLSERVE